MTSHLLAYCKKNPNISKMSHSNNIKVFNHLFILTIYSQIKSITFGVIGTLKTKVFCRAGCLIFLQKTCGSSSRWELLGNNWIKVCKFQTQFLEVTFFMSITAFHSFFVEFLGLLPHVIHFASIKCLIQATPVAYLKWIPGASWQFSTFISIPKEDHKSKIKLLIRLVLKLCTAKKFLCISAKRDLEVDDIPIQNISWY